MKILLLEDDDFICEQIKTYFELNDHFVDVYHDGEALLENALLDNFDIFLFDINTPKKNGLETLAEIRKTNTATPSIFLTALSDIEFVKKGYNAGCNDYVRKPFNIEELELRIMQLVHKNSQNIIKIDRNYNFDMSHMELAFDDIPVSLNVQEKNLIYILLKNKGTVVPPETIKDYVWEDKSVCDNTLRTKIKKLRSKLKNNFIQNVRNLGYKIADND